jgi:hypothetical protein
MYKNKKPEENENENDRAGVPRGIELLRGGS